MMKCVQLIYFVSLFFLISCSKMNSNTVIEKLQNGHYSIKHDNIALEIDPDLGARVISAKINEDELLLQERDSLLNWGSTFWLSPQSAWNWPPPQAIHLGNYQSRIEGDRLLLTSKVDAKFGISASKEFHYNEKKKCLEIQYKIVNETDSVQHYGPWEITVVPAEGAKVFFPMGEEPEGTKGNIEFENNNGIAWFKYEHKRMEVWHKIFNNPAEGWLAHINKERTLFIKSFELISPKDIAPAQGNVEVYISKKFKYIELENHGKYTILPPGESLSYKVNWYISKLPDGISADQYTEELVKLVRTFVR